MGHEAAISGDELPIVCSLTAHERVARVEEIDDLFTGIEQVQELGDGYALRFPGTPPGHNECWTSSRGNEVAVCFSPLSWPCSRIRVPWVVTTDNLKTVVLGRDAQHRPLWHPTYQKLAAEFGFHPEACTPAAGNQKGAVENLVKFVQSNFLAGRTFHDDLDLEQECCGWLEHINTARPSQATEQTPAALLAVEQAKFGPLPATAADYGFFDSLVVSREAVVHIDTNGYSVPVQYVGQVVSARIHRERIELFVGAERVATHARHPGRNARIIDPAHFAAALEHKPRGRVMLYRDWLINLSSAAADYGAMICHKRRAEMDSQVLALYDLAQRLGRTEFLQTLERAAQQLYGAEYIRAMGACPPSAQPTPVEARPGARMIAGPPQGEVERPLADYEGYVANRARLEEEEGSDDPLP